MASTRTSVLAGSGMLTLVLAAISDFHVLQARASSGFEGRIAGENAFHGAGAMGWLLVLTAAGLLAVGAQRHVRASRAATAAAAVLGALLLTVYAATGPIMSEDLEALASHHLGWSGWGTLVASWTFAGACTALALQRPRVTA